MEQKPHNFSFIPVDYDPFEKKEEKYYSTESQREIFVSVKIGEDQANCAYNESVTLHLSGPLNVNALQTAISKVIARHDSLRIVFSADGTEIRFIDDVNSTLAINDFSIFDHAMQEQLLNDHAKNEVVVPFDLEKGPLCRFTLIKLNDDLHYLSFTAHHIICDGWSLSLVFRDISTIYSSLVSGTELRISEANSFAECASANNMNGEEARLSEKFWLDQYTKNVPTLDFPNDKPRPKFRTFNANRIDVQVPEETVIGLRELGKKHKTSFVTLMLSAFEVFLHRITNQRDIVLGLPAAGQNNEGLMNLVGHCVNLLPLKSHIDPQISFEEYLKMRRSYVFDAFDHQRFTFGSLLNKLNVVRDSSRIPLVPIVFNIDIGFTEGFDFEGLTFDYKTNPRLYENFEIFLNACGEGNKLVLECTYNTDLFSESIMQLRMKQFIQLLNSILVDISEKIANLQVITHTEQILIEGMNSNRMEYAAKVGLHEVIADYSQKTPNNSAVSFNSDKISFAELDRRATNLAASLQFRGAKQGVFVGVCLPRTIDLPVVLLAILKTGAAYVPLDPNFPFDRIALMLEDSDASLVITTNELGESFNFPKDRIFILGTEQSENISFSPVSVIEDQVAYVLYTSGSTGKPKGVVVRHRNLMNTMTYLKGKFSMNSSDSFLAITTISFDISVLEIFFPLFCGGRVHIATREQALEASWVDDTIKKQSITYLQATPATWELFYAAGWQGNSNLNILCGGEAFRSELATKLVSTNKSVWNMYGPTETTIWSTMKEVKHSDIASSRNGTISIGSALANTFLYVVDEFGKPCPLGVSGELWIGGDGVSAGYLNRSELNKEKFNVNPYDNGMIYRTGDRVVVDEKGELHFINRFDFQVKVRGYRIELGEIESLLHTCQDIRQAVVVALPGVMGENYLAAYFTPLASGYSIPAEELQAKIVSNAKKTLAKSLPEYMIPTSWMLMDTFPLTPNSKIDRKALPKPEILYDNSVIEEDLNMNPIERLIAEIWERTLNRPKIKVNDNFFELGGHSLLAVKVMVELEQATGIKMPLAVLFTNPTVRGLSQEFDKPQDNERWGALVTIKDTGTQNPIYFVHGISGNVFKYHLLAQLLDHDQPSYGLQAVGLNGIDEPFTNMELMAEHHVEEILKFQPEGPYAIAGGSFGGYLAYEIAQQLRARNKEVSFLCLFDLDAGSELEFMSSGKRKLIGAQLLAQRFVKRAMHFIASDKKQRKEYLQALKKNGINKEPHDELESWLDKHNMAEMIGEESASYFRKVEEACYEALQGYQIKSYDGNVLIVRAKDGYYNNTYAHDLGWSHFVSGKVDVKIAPGDHNSIFWEPFVYDLAKIVDECAKQANRVSLVS